MSYLRSFLILAIGFLLLGAACVPAEKGPYAANLNHPHLPPPGFPVNEAPNEAQRSCGGMTAEPAPSCNEPQEYCHRNIRDICGAADAPGVCRIRPEICTQDYSPVCGCDGKTYSNECTANSNGVSAVSLGECSK